MKTGNTTEIKTYVLTLARTFPKGHPREGQETGFREALLAGRKRHTIRRNYPLWAARFEEIAAGRAVLSVREWTGKPYRSPQREIIRFPTWAGIGIQKLTFRDAGWGDGTMTVQIDGKKFCGYFNPAAPLFSIRMLAAFDGLSPVDWWDWFKDGISGAKVKEFALIHFTDFRY